MKNREKTIGRARYLRKREAGLRSGMIFNSLRFATRHVPSPDDDALFVQKVKVPRRLHPVDAFVLVGWALILGKCVLASLAIHRWQIPIDDFYVWGPSCIFGALCTWLYLTRPEK